MPQEQYFLVADFDNIRLRQAPEHRLSGILEASPQRFAQVWIKGNDLSLFFRVGHGFFRRSFHGFIRKAEGAKVEIPAVIYQ